MDFTKRRKDEIDENVWKSIVADSVRQEVLEALEDFERPVALADLAIELARESDGQLDDSEWGRAKRLRINLHHRHVLKLQYAGLVEFNPERMTVTLAQGSNPSARPPATSSEENR